MTLTFMELWRRWPDCSAHGRMIAFGSLPERAEAECWAALAAECRERNEFERRELYLEPPKKRHQPRQRSTAATSTRPGTVALSSTDDPLKAVPPAVYFEAIAGIVVPPNGWVSCPMPLHEDLHPSCQVTNTHWRCWSCGAGGSIIDLAAALYGLIPRGRGYWELRDLIVEALGGATLYPREDR
jgi:hypothetical protein